MDHGIRGPEGRDDAEFVRRMAAGLSLRFHLARLDLAGSRKRAATPETSKPAARAERYRFLAEVAAKRRHRQGRRGPQPRRSGGDHVHVAAPRLRPRGAEGHAGGAAPGRGGRRRRRRRPVDPSAPGGLPRLRSSPYLESRGLDYREDGTNRDTRYLRNWIRRTLLPGLREQYRRRSGAAARPAGRDAAIRPRAAGAAGGGGLPASHPRGHAGPRRLSWGSTPSSGPGWCDTG